MASYQILGSRKTIIVKSSDTHFWFVHRGFISNSKYFKVQQFDTFQEAIKFLKSLGW